MKNSRRQFLLGATALALGRYGYADSWAPIPKTQLSVASLGGVPGASPTQLKYAFTKALAMLRRLGGGELLVPPGVYDFGIFATSKNVIQAHNLKNVRISAYGASFVMTSADTGATTKLAVRPFLFYFTNPKNVTMAGAFFYDRGFKPMVWQGMFGVHAGSTVPTSGFTMTDCSAESVCGLFLAIDDKRLLRDVNISGRVRNAYYGVSMHNVGDNAKVNLACEDVRRGAMLYGMHSADIDIRLKCNKGFYGSNGFICVCSNGASVGNIDNVRVKLDASGVESHLALVHFYHQEDEARGYICNVDATVTANLTTEGKNRHVNETNIFVFDHELKNGDIAPITARVWDQIALHGKVEKSVSGSVISNPSRSTSPGVVHVDANLAALLDMSALPKQFTV